MATTTFVESLYGNILHRDSDSGGKAYWMQQIDSGKLTTAQVTDAFVDSSEFLQSIAPIANLYNTIFSREADKDGLNYWINLNKDGMTLQEIASNFLISQEYTNAHTVEVSNDSFIESLYVHALGRASDADGKAHWISELSNGMSKAQVMLNFSNSLELANLKGEDVKSMVMEHSGLIASSSATTKGVVSDGYISGATVFADANHDGIWNAGEVKATTNASGEFTLVGGRGDTVAMGGKDISTGLAFDGKFTAPKGSTTVSALTTLVDQVMKSDTTATASQAAATVAQALGISSTVNLLTFDPIKAATDTASSTALKAIAMATQSAAVQVTNMLSQSASMLSGAGVTANGATAAAASLASMIVTASAASTTVDIKSADTMKTFLDASATKAGASVEQVAKVAAVSSSVATATANINSTMADSLANAAAVTSAADVFKEFAKTQVAAGDIAALTKTAAQTGSTTAVTAAADKSTIVTAAAAKADAVTAAETAAHNAIVAEGGTPPAANTPTAPTTTATPPSSGGGGGGSAPAAPTFTASLDGDGVLTFSGTATGDISISWEGDVGYSVATFTKGEVTATTTVDFTAQDTYITLASGQTLSETAENLNYFPVYGTGTINVTGAATENDSIPTPYTYLGNMALNVTGAVDFTGLNGLGDNASFVLNPNASIQVMAGDASGKTITGSGEVGMYYMDAETVTTGFASSLSVTAIFGQNTDVSAYTNLTPIDNFSLYEGRTLTITAEQLDGKSVLGAGNTIVTASDSDDTFSLLTPGTNSITAGKGLDTITLANSMGTDTIVIAAATGDAASDSTPTAIDTINNFDIAHDKLDLTGGTELLADGSYNNLGRNYTVSNGIITSIGGFIADGRSISDIVDGLLTRLDTTTKSVAFETADGLTVVQGNGVIDSQSGDIVVNLAGVTGVTDLSTILADVVRGTASDLAADGASLVGTASKVVITGTTAATVAELKAINNKTGGTITLNDATNTANLSGTVADVAAALSGITTYTGNVTLTDEGSVAAAHLSAIGEATTGTVTGSNISAVSGYIWEVLDALVYDETKATVMSNVAVTLSDENEVYASDLSAIGGATTGTVTGSSIGWVTGSAAEVLAALVTADTKVTVAADAAVTFNCWEDSVAATVLSAIGGATTGTVTASYIHEVTGSKDEVLAALVAADTKVTVAAYTAVTISDTGSVAAADLNAINALSGVVTATGITEVTGSATEVAAFAAADAARTIITATNYAATVTGTDMTVVQAMAIDAQNGSGIITGTVTGILDDFNNLSGTNHYTVIATDQAVGVTLNSYIQTYNLGNFANTVTLGTTGGSLSQAVHGGNLTDVLTLGAATYANDAGSWTGLSGLVLAEGTSDISGVNEGGEAALGTLTMGSDTGSQVTMSKAQWEGFYTHGGITANGSADSITFTETLNIATNFSADVESYVLGGSSGNSNANFLYDAQQTVTLAAGVQDVIYNGNTTQILTVHGMVHGEDTIQLGGGEAVVAITVADTGPASIHDDLHTVVFDTAQNLTTNGAAIGNTSGYDHIIHYAVETDTGAIYYDADGDWTAGSVQIGAVGVVAGLASTDFGVA